MKKILLFVFPLFLSIASQAQATFIPDSGNTDTVSVSGSGTQIDVANYIRSASATPVKLKWKVISYKFDAGWDAAATGVCDNALCRYDVPALMAATRSEYSDPYTTRSLFDVQFSLSNAASGSKASVTILFTDTVGAGYSRTLTFIAVKSSLSIGQSNTGDNSVSVYPNPARDYVNVIFDKQTNVRTIAIYNMIGKTMRVFKPADNNSARLDLDAIPSGVYFVRLMDAEGKVVATRRFTRQ